MGRYDRLALGLPEPKHLARTVALPAKELANRFLAVQVANRRNPKTALRCYRDWLRRFLGDHAGLLEEELTIERFAAWKLSLRRRKYSLRSINHHLGAVRTMAMMMSREQVGRVMGHSGGPSRRFTRTRIRAGFKPAARCR